MLTAEPVAEPIAAVVERALATGNAEELTTAQGRRIILFARGSLAEAKAALCSSILRSAAPAQDTQRP